MKLPTRFPSIASLLVLMTILGSGLWFLASRLVFSPVPWPDGSAFYLPALELVHWPPTWRMHSQAAFVPTYDVANFNLMPLLPLILGVAARLGLNHLLEAQLMIRAVSMIALLLWAWVAFDFSLRALRRTLHSALDDRRYPRLSFALSAALALACLWDPVTRWGTLVVRTETWVCLCWLLILRELHGLHFGDVSAEKKRLWRISALLATGAYFHFEAIFMVPGTILALASGRGDLRRWGARVAHVGLSTLAFLSPWLLYVLSHPALFQEQMQVQFGRLAHGNGWLANAYLLFHGIAISMGMAGDWPKFFNLGKAVLWAIVIAAHGRLFSILRAQAKAPPRPGFPLILGAATGFWTAYYLWCTKPEVWFTVLVHFSLWSFVLILLIDAAQSDSAHGEKGRDLKWLGGLTSAFAVISLAVAGVQQARTRPYYSWQTYRAWEACIVRDIERSPHGLQSQVWQPFLPDVLVDLATDYPELNLTRSLDFYERFEAAQNYARQADVVIGSTYFDVPKEAPTPDYDGPQRPEDIDHARLVTLRAASWAITELPREEPGKFLLRTCHQGPYWAQVLVRDPHYAGKAAP